MSSHHRGDGSARQYFDISADRHKNAAATKKLAIFDAFEILARIESEEDLLNNKPKNSAAKAEEFKGFAEGRSR